MARLHRNVSCLVDGDGEGLLYVERLQASETPPISIIRWNNGAMIEDAVGWILLADEANAISQLSELTVVTPTTAAEVVTYLKAKKMDVIAYELVAEAIATTPACRERAADLLGGLACAGTGSLKTKRFVPDENGVWVFQP